MADKIDQLVIQLEKELAANENDENKEKTTMYLTDDDEWYIDTTDWSGLHDAWVNQDDWSKKLVSIADASFDVNRDTVSWNWVVVNEKSVGENNNTQNNKA